MNTERPDNDDAATASGGEEQKGVPEVRGAREQEGAPEVEGSGSAGTSETEDGAGATEAGGTEAGAGAARSDEPQAAPESPEPERQAARTRETEDAGVDGVGAPVAEEIGAEEARPAEAPAGEPHADEARGDGARTDKVRTDEVRADLAQAGGVRTEAAHAEEAPENEVRADDARAELPARRRTPAVIASVAAAVLLVGGGGAYLAASASGGSDGRATSGAPSGDDTPPPLALDGYSEGGANGIAPGEPNPYGATYQAAGTLPGAPGPAPVYRAQGEVTEEEVARLAKALGIDGTPVAEGQAWQVGAGKDGQGPSLRVNKQAPGAWTFNRYVPGTDNCQKTTTCAQDPADPADDPVTEAAAKKAAAPVLKAIGQDDAKVDASQVMGAQRVVNADPVVGGLPTYGWTTGLTVGAQGEVVGGSGQLKAPAEGDTYPVVSARKALDLMNAAPKADHRMGIGGCASPVPLKDRLEEPCGSSTGSPGSSTDAPKQDTITVEKAVFGLASHVVDGRQALVPSWLFEVRAAGAQDTFTVTYPAVDPKYLASPTPSGEPSGQPSGPGDEPTSAPAPEDVKVEGYTAEGTELTVVFTGGVCADYKAEASETADKVTVTVTETPWPDAICIMIAKQYQQTVQLDEPLGDREVVGSDGKAIPLEKPGARLPAPPSRTR